MPIVYGPVASKKVTKSQKGTSRITPSQVPSDASDPLTVVESGVCTVCTLQVLVKYTAVKNCPELYLYHNTYIIIPRDLYNCIRWVV